MEYGGTPIVCLATADMLWRSKQLHSDYFLAWIFRTESVIHDARVTATNLFNPYYYLICSRPRCFTNCERAGWLALSVSEKGRRLDCRAQGFWHSGECASALIRSRNLTNKKAGPISRARFDTGAGCRTRTRHLLITNFLANQ